MFTGKFSVIVKDTFSLSSDKVNKDLSSKSLRSNSKIEVMVHPSPSILPRLKIPVFPNATSSSNVMTKVGCKATPVALFIGANPETFGTILSTVALLVSAVVVAFPALSVAVKLTLRLVLLIVPAVIV